MKPFAALSLVFVLLLLLAVPVSAAPPVISTGTFVVDYEVIPGLCPDFAVWEYEVGTYRDTVFYDNQGTPVRQSTHYLGTDEWYNKSDPTKRLTGPVNLTVHVDLLTGEMSIQGVFTGVTAPGYGTVLQWAGRTTNYPDGPYVGKYPLAEPKDLKQFCDLLASD